MTAPKALEEFVVSARQLMEKVLADKRSDDGAASNAHYARALNLVAWECSGHPSLESLATDIGGTTESHVEDALRRCGVYARLAKGQEVDLESVWSQVTTRLLKEEVFLGALQLQGVSMESASIPLTDGYELRRFTAEEWEDMQSQVEHERIDPEIVTEQVFLTKDRTHVFPPRRPTHSFLEETPEESLRRRDALWTDWWPPLLALALYRPEDFRVGVRLEITPGWRVQRSGDFEGEFLPPWYRDPDTLAGEVIEIWRNSMRDEYRIKKSQEADLTASTASISDALRLAVKVDEHRFRIASKRFLDAAFRLPGYISGWRPDEDEIERVILDLVRAVDGLLGGDPRPKKKRKSLTDTFADRAALVRGEDCKDRLTKAYKARSEIAHGRPLSDIPDLCLLHEDIRFIFLGVLGLTAHYRSRKVMLKLLDSRQEPTKARELQKLARRATRRQGYPQRRSRE